jgi:hypothetical protein
MLTYADICPAYQNHTALPRVLAGPTCGESQRRGRPRSGRSVGRAPPFPAPFRRQVCSRMLTHAHVCSRTLTYAHVCSRMLTYAHGSAKPASLAQLLPHAERESAVALERTCPPTRGRLARVAAEGTHFTCFTGTKVQVPATAELSASASAPLPGR